MIEKIDNEKPARLAFLELQRETGAIQKNEENTFFRRGAKAAKYATLDKIWLTIQPLIIKHGFFHHNTMVFENACVVEEIKEDKTNKTTKRREGREYLRCHLTHAETGVDFSCAFPISAVKEDAQGYGSAVTYARRYALCALLGIVTNEDDDGNNASGNYGAPQHPTSAKPAGKPAAPNKPAMTTPSVDDDYMPF